MLKIITQCSRCYSHFVIKPLFSHHDFTRFFLQFGFGVEIFSWNFEIVVLKTNFWVFWRNWADDKQTSWIIALWWLSVSLWQICITFVWPSRIFCIDKTVPGTKPPGPGAIIKIPVVRCHYLWCLGAQYPATVLFSCSTVTVGLKIQDRTVICKRLFHIFCEFLLELVGHL